MDLFFRKQNIPDNYYYWWRSVYTRSMARCLWFLWEFLEFNYFLLSSLSWKWMCLGLRGPWMPIARARAPRCRWWPPLAHPPCLQPQHRSTQVAPREGTRNADGGPMMMVRSPTTTTSQPTWMPLVARQGRSLCPRCAPRIVQSRFWAVVEWMLDDRVLGGGGGHAVGRAPNWCAVCLHSLVDGRVPARQHALATANGSLPQH
jgi:hypothetical protein